MIRTGDGGGYSGVGFQAKAIQKFQAMEDKESAFLNHSWIFVWLTLNGKKELFVLEAGYLPNYKLKAAVKLTPFRHYQNMDGKCYHFKRRSIEHPKLYLQALAHYTGTPYDYLNLLRNQIWLKLTGLWVGLSKRPQRKLICHEMTMTVENYYAELAGKPLPYKDAEKGKVKDIFSSPLYYDFTEI